MLYEIVTESPPYPELDQDRISLSKFHKKVAKENYRPVFRGTFNKKLQELIEQCWSTDPEDRPKIGEVLTKLTDPDYFLDDNVDQEEVELYLEDLSAGTILDN